MNEEFADDEDEFPYTPVTEDIFAAYVLSKQFPGRPFYDLPEPEVEAIREEFHRWYFWEMEQAAKTSIIQEWAARRGYYD